MTDRLPLALKALGRAVCLTAGLALAGPALASGSDDPAQPEGPTGLWLTQGGSARIDIAPCAEAPDTLCGTVMWLREPFDADGNPLTDGYNPDPDLRDRPILGIRILTGFEHKKRHKWVDGTIYDPNSGKAYDSKLELEKDGTLSVSGCILFLCQDQTWIRAEPEPALSADPSLFDGAVDGAPEGRPARVAVEIGLEGGIPLDQSQTVGHGHDIGQAEIGTTDL